ncbi:MAG: LysM peptidoglycan-binding domain-containing protein [Gammaproteobacteria bacterium]|nr:LysM peptidoglycan-binding domain-containing protein [Gammaproteobacteria bacterium]
MKRLLFLSLGLCILTSCQTDSSRVPEVPDYAVPEDAVSEPEQPLIEPSDKTAESPDDADLWRHVRSGFQLDSTEDPKLRAEVNKQIRFFTQNQRTVEASLNRAAPYLYMVVQEIEKRDLPLELALLPIIESSYNPKARGANGAGGLWQFVPGTAKVMGLKKNSYYDAKQDVFASTQAALDYLDNLGKTFDGDWFHALAAYNSGAGNVQRAMDSNKAHGKGTDFTDLKLKAHTRAYVPKLLALAEMLKDPERYGIDWDPVPNEPVMAKVDLDKPIALSEAAELANCSLEELVSLNPGFAKPWAVSGGPGYLMLPADKAEDFEGKLSHLPTPRSDEHLSYTVRKGDTLRSIAKQYHMPQELLRQANHLFGMRQPEVGQELKIPLSNKPVFDESDEAVLAESGGREHKIRSGDSLWKLSRSYKVSMKALAEANGLAANAALKPGKTLRIPGAATDKKTDAQPQAKTVALAGTEKQLYTVKKGDSLDSIAQKHKIALKDLMRWNNKVSPRNLKPGQALVIYLADEVRASRAGSRS